MCCYGDPSELGALFVAPRGAVRHPDPSYQLRQVGVEMTLRIRISSVQNQEVTSPSY